MRLKSFFKSLLRKKYFDDSSLSESNLNRCLSTLDLTALGIGSTLGLGIYVLAGQVASTKAGPSVSVSFFIAAVASVFAGLCYAEFGARVPRAGSAYVYSYVTVGELVAFIIGWNLILEYVIGTASVARGYSGYFDSLINNTIKSKLEEVLPLHLQGISTYPDFLALGITLLLTVMLIIGVKESTRFNNVFTGLNLLVVIYVVVVGAFKADIHNWQLTEEELIGHNNTGTGGFMPFGFSGMMEGAATCFYAFVGFDCIATTGEEVRNPQKAIPIGIVTSLLIVFFAYFGVSTIQTLVWPYWDQDNNAPLPYVFKMVGWPVAAWIISIGALAGLSTSLLGGMFPLPRVLYAMANDGLIFRQLANVHPKFKTPVLATAISGVFAGVMAMMFDVHELAEMMSIGTLLAYTLVATSILILRYHLDIKALPLSPPVRIPDRPNYAVQKERCDTDDSSCNQIIPDLNNVRSPYQSMTTSTILASTHQYSRNQKLRQLFNLDRLETPTILSSRISTYLVISITLALLLLNLLLVELESYLFKANIAVLVAVGIVLIFLVILVTSLGKQPSNQKKISFKVPFVPVVPVLSMFVNIYLMLKLSNVTWIRFAVWMIVGLLIYFGYGIRNSSERMKRIGLLPSNKGNNDTEEKYVAKL